MTTNDEAIGMSVAGQAFAVAALRKLIDLGHKDEIEAIKLDAEDMLKRSVDESQAVDKDKAFSRGKLQFMAFEAAASFKLG
ncbi:hypothetical protein [Agrobacterium vaccinii]|uniref:hypothetical protein n=1 Tax=Agrobacterium vaccinii TaxID=2735528 RepID=UPI001E4DDE28|nr:hypothetical protein [Agrobacterium vaccinii]UHS56830.1 hypothetical protein HRS00_08455 [Agrobacterium vaccinii]